MQEKFADYNDEFGIPTLEASGIRALAGNEQNPQKYAQIVIDFLTNGEALDAEKDIIETFFTKNISITRNYQNRGHEIMCDSIKDRIVELGGLFTDFKTTIRFFNEIGELLKGQQMYFNYELAYILSFVWTGK